MGFRSLFLLALPLLSTVYANSLNDESSAESDSTVNGWEETLKALPDESIEAALEHHTKYREGIFEDGLSAIAAVHLADPGLASRLVDLAKQDAEVKDYLRKRQNNNTTTPATTSSVVTPPPDTTSDTTPTSDSSPSSGQSSPTSDQSLPATPPPSSTSSESTAVGSTSTPGETSLSAGSSTSEDRSTSSESVATPSPSETASVNEPTSAIDSSSSDVSSSSQNQGSQTIPVPASPTSDTSVQASSTTPAASDTAILTGPTQTGVLVPVESSTTVDGSTLIQTSVAFQTSAPTSVAVPVTSTDDEGSVVVSTSMAPAAIVSFTNSQGSMVTTAVPLTSVAVAPGGSIVHTDAPLVTSTDSSGVDVVLTSPTSGGVYTQTNARGAVVTVTYRPGGGTVSQLQVQTETLPNGQQTVITSYAEVGAPTSDVATDATPAASDTPDLQNGAAVPSSYYAAEIAMVLGAAIGVAGLIL